MISRVHEQLRRAALITCLLSLAWSSTFVLAPLSISAATSPATQLAQELLNDAITPPAAVLAHPSTTVLCQCEGAPAMGTVTTEHRYYIISGPPTGVENYLTTHIPKGGTYNGSVDTTNSSNGLGIISIAITYRANGPHVYLKQLAYSMTKRTSSTSWLRIDSQIVWVPSRTKSETVSDPFSATITGYKMAALSGNSGDVRIHLSGRKLTKLVNEFNALPLGPTNACMEDSSGFTMSLTLKSGEQLQIFNGFCGGPFDEVIPPTGNLNDVRYRVSDHSCDFMRAVMSLFPATSAAGSHAALHSCEAWLKTSNS
jgi:hypothetical protein